MGTPTETECRADMISLFEAAKVCATIRHEETGLDYEILIQNFNGQYIHNNGRDLFRGIDGLEQAFLQFEAEEKSK